MSVAALMFLMAAGIQGDGNVPPKPMVAYFEAVSDEMAVILLNRRAFLVNLQDGSARLIGPAVHAAADRVSGTVMLAETEGGRPCRYRLVLWRMRPALQKVAEARTNACVCRLVPANFSPVHRYALIWMCPAKPLGGLTGCSYVWRVDRSLVFVPIPVLSGITAAVKYIIFARNSPGTLAATILTTFAAKDVFPEDFGGLRRYFDTKYLVVFRAGKIARCYPVGGLDRPVAFSPDGRRLLVNACFLDRPRSYPLKIINLARADGEVTECRFIPEGTEVLATSDDLQTVVVRDGDKLLLAAAGRRLKLLGHVNAEVRMVGTSIGDFFYVTDGVHIWRSTTDGRASKMKLKAAVSSRESPNEQ